MDKTISFIKKILNNPHIQVAVSIIMISLLYFITLNTLPFHPDEATYLYMSDDFDAAITNPLSISYHQGQTIDLKTHYRLMDPPMISLYLGMARNVAGLPPVNNDWNWAESWEENLINGNYPPENVLFVGRIAIYLLFPFTCYFIYRTAKNLLPHWIALVVMILFALNPLVQLHTRHVMTEAVFLFFSAWLLMLFTDSKKHIFLIPIILTFAINSKQTAIFFLPAYGIQLIWSLINTQSKDRIRLFAAYLFIPIALTFMLNPIAWSEPLPTIQTSIEERNVLMKGNKYFMEQNQPERLELGVPERFLIIIYHAAYEPLAFDDIPNYRNAQQVSIDQYNSVFFQNYSRNVIIGTLQVIMIFTAIIIQLMEFLKQGKSNLAEWYPWGLIYISLFSTLLGLSILSSIYQRYVIVLIPFFILILGWFLSFIVSNIKKQPV